MRVARLPHHGAHRRADQNEHRALQLLGALDAVGTARRLPRLRIASLAEQVRLHARRFRAETCRDLCRQIDALLASPTVPRAAVAAQRGRHAPARPGYAAMAAQDWRGAVQPLAEVEAVALQTQRVRVHIEALGLRAYALDRCGERSDALRREAMDLAESCGCAGCSPAPTRLWATGSAVPGPRAPPRRHRRAHAPARPPAARATPSMALTPKEREVLELLARNLSNKEIGLAMQVGEEPSSGT